MQRAMREHLLRVAGSTLEEYLIEIFSDYRDISPDAAASWQANDSAGLSFDKDSRKRQIHRQLRQRIRQELSRSITRFMSLAFNEIDKAFYLYILVFFAFKEYKIASDFGSPRARHRLREFLIKNTARGESGYFSRGQRAAHLRVHLRAAYGLRERTAKIVSDIAERGNALPLPLPIIRPPPVLVIFKWV